MSARLLSESANRSLPDNLDLQMLQDAQACLRCLRAHQTPSDVEIQAFRCLHATYDPVIRRFVIRCGVPADDADDCCQEVWKDLYIKLTSFNSDGSQARFCSWLKRIAHSKAVDLRRYQMRHRTERLPKTEKALVSRDAEPAALIEERCLEEEMEKILDVLRQQVSELSFRIVWMHLIGGRTPGEIAAELNQIPRNISDRLYKAKRKFQKLCEMHLKGNLWTDG
jgi:RNA polymerase sigma factor (sigma-70 family)